MHHTRSIFLVCLLMTSISFTQTTYFVSSQGNDSNSGTSEASSWKTINKVNSSSFNPGDIVSFKSGQIFSDAVLECKQGVTYTTYGGTTKAILGDSLGNTSTATTIKVDYQNVTLTNLKTYGYANAGNIIRFSANNLTIDSCEIIGGLNAHSAIKGAIYQAGWNGIGHKFTNNKIHGIKIAIRLAVPYNVEIGYNEIYDLWEHNGAADWGGYAIGFTTTYNQSGTDVHDAEYTFLIHHNNIHDFEYTAFAAGVSRTIYEYNEIHHNLDERIYMGGVKHGDIGKIHDAGPNGTEGCVGLIFRYNYVHDLIRRGLPNHTYKRPTYLPTNIPIIVSTNNGTGEAIYLGAGGGSFFGENYGDDIGEGPDPIFSGMGYGNYYVHNNIFYNVSKFINYRSNSLSIEWRDDLGSYFLNNTIINCGGDYTSLGNGLIGSFYNTQSPHTVVNNIIDFVNPNAGYAIRWREKYLYLDYNIYTNQSGTTTIGPNQGEQKAAWFEAGSELSGHSNEKYLTNPNWVDPNSTIFATNIGVNGVNIPDVRITNGGNAYNTGKPYNTIGDTYNEHSLGKDPTGRSFAYDIFGNLRSTNDIGAVGTDGSSNNPDINVNTRIWLQGPFYSGSMLPSLQEEGHIPLNQNFSTEPWNYNGNESVSSVPNSVIDWVLLELRTGTAASTTVARKAAFLKDDGSIVDLDGIRKPSFGELSPGSYYLVLRHRNHLGVMSANYVSLSSNSSLYDFTTGPDKAYGSDPLCDLGNGMWGMYAGDGDYNGIVNVIDYGSVGNSLLQTGYKNGDLDLNGVVNILDYAKTNQNLFRNSQVPN